MADEVMEFRTIIKSDLRAAYYDDFHCIMGACQTDCCDDGWKIEFSKRDYLTIKHAPKSPELEKLMSQCMHRIRNPPDNMYAGFYVGELGRCAFHAPDGLCRLQVECGAKTLPKVCREFPRKDNYMPSGYLERILSCGCESVLELLWNLPEGVDFRSAPLPEEEHRMYTVKGLTALLPYFQDIRSQCIDILQDRRFLLPERIMLIGLALKKLAEGETDIPRWLEQNQQFGDSPSSRGILNNANNQQMITQHLAYVLSKLFAEHTSLSSLRPGILEWLDVEESAENVSFRLDIYYKAREKYREIFAGREYFMENLMVSLFFQQGMPVLTSKTNLWKSYVKFCNVYAIYHLLVVMSCREGVADNRSELFRLLVLASRKLLHNQKQWEILGDELFDHDNATLAHMAVLLSG